MYIVIEILYSLFYRKLYRKFTLMAYKVFDCMIQTFFIYVKYMFKFEIPIHVSQC